MTKYKLPCVYRSREGVGETIKALCHHVNRENYICSGDCDDREWEEEEKLAEDEIKPLTWRDLLNRLQAFDEGMLDKNATVRIDKIEGIIEELDVIDERDTKTLDPSNPFINVIY